MSRIGLGDPLGNGLGEPPIGAATADAAVAQIAHCAGEIWSHISERRFDPAC